jgi:hypothetical protein
MNKTIFDATTDAIKVVASQTNPLQKQIEFVFTDFLPNKNKEGVREKEADNIIRTGINMPIKVDFRGGKVGDHPYSIPVGPITSMRRVGDQVHASAILWKDEFGELADYLEKASASEDGVHFSWELYYGGKSADDDGTTWYDDVVVAGATMVAKPAYAGRTPLLAYASEDFSNKVEDLERQVAALSEQLSHSEGEKPMEPVDELKQQVADLEKRLVDLEAAKSTEEPVEASDEQQAPDVATLQTELEELRLFKSNVEKQQQRDALLASRRDVIKDVLSDDEYKAKSDFIAELSDDQFKTFTETLVTAAQKAQKVQSSLRNGIPDPIGGSDGNVTTASLAEALRGARKK